MGFYEHMTYWAGKRVVDWPAKVDLLAEQVAFRVGMNWREYEKGLSWLDRFATLVSSPLAPRITALVVGPWHFEGMGSEVVVEALVAARDRMPNLTAIFVGDIISEEYEVSWIAQSDMAPLFNAYPALEHLGVRGSRGLRLGLVRHEALESLILQSGGLDAGIVHEVTQAQLPRLEHLELWLGTPSYGGNTRVEDLAPILSGELFSRLRYLGLRDSEIADALAQALARAPVLEGLETLDLSLGTLTDEGAAALLDSPAVAVLQRLDLHYHYCSAGMVEKLLALPPEVLAGDAQSPDMYEGEAWRYVAVGE